METVIFKSYCFESESFKELLKFWWLLKITYRLDIFKNYWWFSKITYFQYLLWHIHCFFVCEKICEISRRFLEVLKIFDPAFTFEEVIKLRSKEEFPHVNWFIAYTLYYIYNNRQRCSVSQYITFLQTELEILKFSKKKNIEEEIRVLSMMIELIK